jgi:Voltage gated chloride channel
VPPIELPGIVIAAFVTLSLGVVLGPEAPLIAIGSGLGVLVVHLVKRDAPEMASVVIAAAGSFAAISTLLGSPLPAAFLMMEVAGIGGAMLGVVLAPGLLAAGVGSLIFIGLDNWTGLGTFSLAIPDLPPAGSPGVPEFLWAIVVGVVAAFLGAGIKRLALLLQPIVERRMVLLTPAKCTHDPLNQAKNPELEPRDVRASGEPGGDGPAHDLVSPGGASYNNWSGSCRAHAAADQRREDGYETSFRDAVRGCRGVGRTRRSARVGLRGHDRTDDRFGELPVRSRDRHPTRGGVGNILCRSGRLLAADLVEHVRR